VFHDVALPPRDRHMWDGMVTHNPTVLKVGKTYYLYYMGNTGDGVIQPTLNWSHRNNNRVGVAVAGNPNGPWKRMDHPLIDVSADKGAPDSLSVSNPSVTRGRDGMFYLLYKAVGQQKPLPFGGPVVHLMATSNSPTGPFQKDLTPMFTIAGNNFPFEDPFFWFDKRRDRYFVIMKDNKGTISGTGQSSLVLYESKDAKNWKAAKHLLVSDLVLHWNDQSAQTVERMERPQISFDEHGEPQVLLVAIYENSETTYNVRIPLLTGR
jgi:beta-xylosidase